MPIYEYRCQSCGHELEKMQRISDPPLTECPECGGELKKLLSAPAFQFKGTGWYVTDYARKGVGKPAEKAAGDGVAASGEGGKGAASGKKDAAGGSGKGESGGSGKSSAAGGA